MFRLCAVVRLDLAMLNPILYAVPVFLLLMALEYAVGRHRSQPIYRAADTVSSLSLGIISQLVAVFTKLASLGVYTLVFDHAAVWRLPVDSVWVWLGSLLAYDFLYYWYHRFGHEMSLLWAAHGVHHSSEEYNLSTALRQTSTGFLFAWIFYLPLALAGVPPLVFVVVGLIDLLYQFWVHTRLIGKLGWFDRIFVSPSNHRVHHGQNDYCIDRNYGGILILWDRMFGSFVEERDAEAIVYGIRQPLRSWNPLRANSQGYASLWHALCQSPGGADRLRLLFKPPGWQPVGKMPAHELSGFERFGPPLPPALALHGLLQLALLIAFGLHFLAVAPTLGLAIALGYALVIALQLAALSRLCEQGLAARRFEAGRWVAGLLLLLASPLHGIAWLLWWLLAGLSGLWAWRLASRTEFRPPVPPAV